MDKGLGENLSQRSDQSLGCPLGVQMDLAAQALNLVLATARTVDRASCTAQAVSPVCAQAEDGLSRLSPPQAQAISLLSAR